MKFGQIFSKSLKPVVLGLSFLGSNLSLVSVSASEPGSRDTLFFATPPSPGEIAEHIFPSRAEGRTRSIFSENADSELRKSVGMPVLFHFGKTTLVESSKPFLDSVGELLQQSEHSSEILIIEGHTDSVGADRSNFKLSERRASAVKEYLVTEYSIDPLRLFTEGKGERQLFNTENGRAQENRRVEFLRYPLWKSNVN